MTRCASPRRVPALAAALAWAVAFAAVVSAQPAAGREYRVTDGMSSDTVSAVYEDGRGFLWIGSPEGLTRFDGYEFRTFSVADGVPHPSVEAIVEDGRGRLWIATMRGLARLREPVVGAAAHEPRFETFVVDRADPQANEVGALLLGPDDALWCVTSAGLFRSPPRLDPPRFERVGPRASPTWLAAFRDSLGGLWFSLGREIVHVRARDGALSALHVARLPQRDNLIAFAERAGRLVVLTTSAVLETAIDDESPRSWRTLAPRLPHGEGRALAVEDDGHLLVGTSAGLFRLDMAGRALELSGDLVNALLIDRAGNLWVGAGGEGLSRVQPESFALLARNRIGVRGGFVRVVSLPTGASMALGRDGSVWRIDGERLSPVATGVRDVLALGAERTLVDRRGRWWIPTPSGLLVARGLGEALRPVTTDRVFAVHESADGRIWATSDFWLYDWAFDSDLAAPRRRPVLAPSVGHNRLAVSAAGTVWLGANVGLARLREGGAIERVAIGGGSAEDRLRALLIDSRGWLWVGLRDRGLAMSRDPEAERPSFRVWTTADGLSSDSVLGLLEEEDGGTLLAVTGRGIDRLDPNRGGVARVPTGFSPPDVMHPIVRDREGRVLLAGRFGLARLERLGTRPTLAGPRAHLTRVSVGAASAPIGARGVAELELGEIGFGAAVNVDFLGLDFGADREIRYERRLDAASWSTPERARSITLAALAPGAHVFEVRAVGAGERRSPSARLLFAVAPPLWRRWWFVAGAVGAVGLLAYGAHAARLRRALAVERVRRQVAADLHDDIGAGLTEIALASDLARLRGAAAADEALSAVSATARAMRESMSDIVWAVDPRHDHAADLVQRMKDLAYRMLETEGCEVSFTAPDGSLTRAVRLDAQQRRHTLLFFKEAAANIARHASASHVQVAVSLHERTLGLRVEDDGCGFDTTQPSRGRGLGNLHARAEALGGSATVESRPGQGAIIDLRVPLSRRPKVRRDEPRRSWRESAGRRE